tara:strand:- start:262 stop:531 length:270 start_codon:yes stop_codon:yes gene_type:complete
MQGAPPPGGPPPQQGPDLPPQIKQKIMEALQQNRIPQEQAMQILQAAIKGDQHAIAIIKQAVGQDEPSEGANAGADDGGGMPPGGGMGG